jgi:serine/threonine-protein kinase
MEQLSEGLLLNGGAYKIERVIGSGGFGITYLARKCLSGDRLAIKEFFINGHCVHDTRNNTVIPQGMDKAAYEKYQQKFFEEAQTLARLNNPHIVKIIDIFNERNTSFMVMPFIEGNTLQQIVERRGRLDYETAVNYIAQLSEAVDYIHKMNILHRDIKPDNIIITPDNKAILIDFGSAREFVQDKTQSHTSILTKGYAPLEQYSTNSRKGSYSDIYSLGGVFYFALTGIKPMDAATRTMETMSDPKTLMPTIPDEANRTIMKAMQLKPENRHQSVVEFMDDLLNTKAERGEKQTVLPRQDYTQSGGMVMPKNYLAASIIVTIVTTLLCCGFPISTTLGIIAIVKANNVNTKFSEGFYEEAIQNSKAAKQLTIWATAVAVVLTIIMTILYIATDELDI